MLMDTAEQIFALTIFATLLKDGYAGGMVTTLKCYSNPEGSEMKRCDETGGYTSCFTKWASDQARVVGRGCSDKGGPGQLLEGDCEAFQSGERTERYCYCSFYLCNKPDEQAAAQRPVPALLLFLVPFCLLRGA